MRGCELRVHGSRWFQAGPGGRVAGLVGGWVVKPVKGFADAYRECLKRGSALTGISWTVEAESWDISCSTSGHA